MTTFSESWHRVREVRVCLRSQVRVHRQTFRGQKWFVLHDPFNNQFFRLPPPAYSLLARLDGSRTVNEAWEEEMAADPDNAPGQQDVVELMGQLYAVNLIYADLPPDTVSLFERYRKRRNREITSKWLSAMFARIPLWDPDDFLRSVLPMANLVLNRWGGLVWLGVIVAALKAVIDRWNVVVAEAGQVLEPSNLFWLYVATLGIKLLHEFGHGIFCRKFGGEVHVFGVMLMVFTPMPYVDATSAWSFRERWQRVLVGAGGMIVELFIASLAAFVWANTGSGQLHALAFNVIFSASVSTLLFNLNPLLRFDGYYILMDWLGMPNLYQRSLAFLRYLGERYLFGLRRERSPATTRKERTWLGFYGVVGGLYRAALFASITLFVANQFFILGAIMASYCLVSWLAVPIGRFLTYLAVSPKLQRTRPRAVAVTAGFVVAACVILAWVPFPSRVRALGEVQADEYTLVATASAGVVEEVMTPSGQTVRAGQPLLRLADPELGFELRIAQSQLQEAESRQRQSRARGGGNLKTLEGVLVALRKREAELSRRKRELTVVAAHDGLWAAPRLPDFVGRWFPRGTVLGEVVNPAKFLFVGKIPTRDALQLVSGRLRSSEVRLLGQPSLPMQTSAWRFVQAAAEASDQDAGKQKQEGATRSSAPPVPVFEVRAELLPGTSPVKLLHGQSGVVRFTLPPEPLLSQWSRQLRQLLQNRPT